MSIFAELKRRNVIRMAILYLVASWILLQLTDVLSSLLPVPEWTGSLVVLLLALGFAPTLIFAWVFEMTPEGLKLEKEVDRSRSITPDTGRKLNSLITVLLIIAIGGLVVDRLIPEQGRDSPPTAAGKQTTPAQGAADPARQARDDGDRSIAVLPFSDLSPNQDQQYFTDGISEELLNVLVRVDGLRVASRTSSFAYRGKNLNIPQIAAELGVGHVLEGSVRKDGDHIRITAQLIEGKTDRHLWSENFDRDLVDIFAIQDDIANAIVSALKGKLGIESDDRAVKVVAATQNLDAYELYLKARALFVARQDLATSIELFEQATRLDPNFARAWEGLAAVQSVADSWLYMDGIDHRSLAAEAASRALAINPELSMPYAVMGQVESNSDHVNWATAMAYYRQAIEKDPKNTSAWLWQGIEFMNAGFLDKSVDSISRCLDIDPQYYNCKQHLSLAYLLRGERDRAIELFEQTLADNFHSVDQAFVAEYLRAGNRTTALLLADIDTGLANAPVIEWIRALENPGADHSHGLERLQRWQQETGVPLARWPSMLIALGDYETFLSGYMDVPSVAWTVEAGAFRQSPAFKQFVRGHGILEYWKQVGFPPQCRPLGGDDFHCD